MNKVANLSIRLARDGDLQRVSKWLLAERLPTDDLSADHLAFIATRDTECVGAIGREYLGDVGLLRSLVVAKQARGQGVAHRLIAALESDARAAAVLELWLLTIDQQVFFEGQGYVLRQRRDAPDEIRTTQEFSGLCPDDAALMSKTL